MSRTDDTTYTQSKREKKFWLQEFYVRKTVRWTQKSRAAAI